MRFNMEGGVMNFIFKYFTGTIILLLIAIGCSPTKEETPVDDPAYTAADGYNGAKLYEKFWDTETGFDQEHPSIPVFDQYSDFFRCINCHGYDLLGRQGGYATFYPSNSKPNAADVNLSARAKASGSSKLFNAIKTGSDPSKRRGIDADLSAYDPVTNNTVGDRMPDYGSILSDDQIWNLVKFIKAEAIDVKQLYDFTISGAYPNAVVAFSNLGKGGNAANGDKVYSDYCASCHGADGTECGGRTGSIGKHLRTFPYEDVYIFRFGLLGVMENFQLTDQEMKDLFKALSDETKYP